MRDGIATARNGIPSIALVTEAFWPQGDFVAQSLGMPGLPRVQLPHPVAGSGQVNMQAIAEQMTPKIIAAFAS